MATSVVEKLKSKAASVENSIAQKREAFERSIAPETAELNEINTSIKWAAAVEKEPETKLPTASEALSLEKVIVPTPPVSFTAKVIEAVDSLEDTISKRKILESMTAKGEALPPDAPIQVSTILGRLEKRLKLTKTPHIGPNGSRSYTKTENWNKD